jgi:hypothetical protein
MKNGTMKKRLLLGALCAAALPASAIEVTEPTQTWSMGYTVGDDGNTAGPFGIEVAGSEIQAITRLEVGLSFSGVPQSADDPGGFAGDLVVTLARVLDVGGTPVITTSHLLNRIGVGTVSGGTFGFDYGSVNVTLSEDAAGGDIHTAAGSLVSRVLTGSFEPDGRALATGNARDFRLSVFNGQPADGTWQLYVTDMSSGGQMRLDSWSLTLTGDNQVPEASTWAAGAALLGLVAWRRWRSR